MTNKRWIPIVATVAVLTISGTALAQRGQGGAGGQGGQGGGFQRGQGGGGMMGGMRGNQGGPAILFRADVTGELKLSTKQLDDLRAAIGQGGAGGGAGGVGGGGQGGRGGAGGGVGGGGQGGRGGAGGGVGGGQGGRGGFGGDPAAMEQRRLEQDAKIKVILDGKQYKRYHELDIQLMGTRALLRPDAAKAVGVTEAQQQQFREIQQSAMEGMRGQFGGGGERPDPEQMRAQMEKIQKEIDAKIMAALDEKQKIAFAALKGAEFKFDQGRGGF